MSGPIGRDWGPEDGPWSEGPEERVSGVSDNLATLLEPYLDTADHVAGCDCTDCRGRAAQSRVEASLREAYAELARLREDNARLAIEAATADQDWKRAEAEVERLRGIIQQEIDRRPCDYGKYCDGTLDCAGCDPHAHELRAALAGREDTPA